MSFTRGIFSVRDDGFQPGVMSFTRDIFSVRDTFLSSGGAATSTSYIWTWEMSCVHRSSPNTKMYVLLVLLRLRNNAYICELLLCPLMRHEMSFCSPLLYITGSQTWVILFLDSTNYSFFRSRGYTLGNKFLLVVLLILCWQFDFPNL